ncbi:glycosyltransferase family 4 protein [Clostridium sp. KNHs214]|uniref:glycosyltransferase family 4 protein n=1 Tax=Clostridium sp. KNHs214 TaxID=1540257 RepID=UPI0005511E57|nr:glycosyltransferase family 4 protein [Clostridium sp. KNHs214]
MRICYLSDANSAHTKKWCQYFVEKGYEVNVISLNSGNINGTKVYSLGFDGEKVGKSSLLYKISYISKVRYVKKLIKEIKPDIVHAHYASSYGLIGSIVNFHPYILSVWGSDVYEFPKKGRIFERIIKYNLSKADLLLSTSKAMAEETKKYTNKSIEITPFGVDTNFFKPKENRYREKKYLTIGIVKTLEKNYGIEYLIKAFAEIISKYPNEKLVLEIGGPGSQLNYLKQLTINLGIDESVKFLGLLNKEEVVNAFNRFDIAVFPSLSESFGVAAVEAQACGTPVIVSDVGGLPEATKPNYSSIVVPKEEHKRLVEAIEELLFNMEIRIQMGKNGRKFIEDNYRIEDNFAKVERIYYKILNG